MSLFRTPAETARETERLIALAAAARARGESIRSTIEGTSMAATLPPGTAIEIDLARRDYEPGAVVAFVTGSSIAAHRLVARGRIGAARNYWIARGDAYLSPDPPVRVDSVLGTVAAPLEGRRSIAARVARALFLGAVTIALHVHVQFAHVVARSLLHVERRLRSAGRRTPATTAPRR